MINIMGAGLMLVMFGGIGYISWTRPKRSYDQKDYSLATIRVSQAAVVVGVALILLGQVAALIQSIF
jgi:hypothetical protein